MNSLPHELIDMIMESLPMRAKCYLALTCKGIHIRNRHYIKAFKNHCKCMSSIKKIKYFTTRKWSITIFHNDDAIMRNYEKSDQCLTIYNMFTNVDIVYISTHKYKHKIRIEYGNFDKEYTYKYLLKKLSKLLYQSDSTM